MTVKAKGIRIGYVLKMFPRFSETFVLNEILELERQGLEVEIFSILPPTEGRFHPHLSKLRAGIHYIPNPGYSDFWNRMRQIQARVQQHRKGYGQALWHALACPTDAGLKYFMRASYIAETSLDLQLSHLHAHFAGEPAQVTMYASMMTGIPYSFTAHAKDIYHKDVHWGLFRDISMNSAFLVTVSRSNQVYLRKNLPPACWPKIIRLYNGVNLDIFLPPKVPRQDALVLSVGRLVEKKGFRYLIEAIGILQRQGFRLDCRIIGDGEEKGALTSLISQLNLGRTVSLLGGWPQDAVLRSMQEAAIFVLPAIIADDGNRDALPTVLLEAMAAGLPVISTDVVGIPEILGGGDCGLLVAQKDPEALAKAMAGLLRNPSLRRDLSRCGREKVEKDFDIRRNVSRLRRLLASSARKFKGSRSIEHRRKA
jgi:colanic acid/amylovoran biosynthesis glycosyltransferase